MVCSEVDDLLCSQKSNSRLWSYSFKVSLFYSLFLSKTFLILVYNIDSTVFSMNQWTIFSQHLLLSHTYLLENGLISLLILFLQHFLIYLLVLLLTNRQIVCRNLLSIFLMENILTNLYWIFLKVGKSCCLFVCLFCLNKIFYTGLLYLKLGQSFDNPIDNLPLNITTLEFAGT